MRSFSTSKKSLSLFLSVLMMIVIQLIITIISLSLIFDISLKERSMNIDFLTRIGLIDDPNYTVSTYRYIIGIKVQYNDYFLILHYLIVITIFVVGLFLLLFIFERNKTTEKQRFRWTSFVFFSSLLSSILLLHFIPSVIIDMFYYDMYARGYNRHLISEGHVVEELYTYFFNKKIGDINSFTNLIEDSILWTIIGFVFVVAVLYIRKENKIKIKKILVKENYDDIESCEIFFLTLVSIDDFDKEISVLGEPLFVDGKLLYRELLYKFKRVRQRRYYQPDKTFMEWLTMIDEFSAWRKNRRLK